MAKAAEKKRFPNGFFWGAATSSYQVEGNIENCDWAKAAREGKVPPCGKACDHYRRYEEDFDIAKSLGHNCHRLSIEWARIEPYEGKFNAREVKHYRAVLGALRARGIEPFVTIWHFTVPQWFADMGGFENNRSPEIFGRYCAYVAKRLGDLCSHFSTINEPHVYASNGWRRGAWPPFKKWPGIDAFDAVDSGRGLDAHSAISWRNLAAYWRVFHHMARGHRAAYDAIKLIRPEAEVGIVKQVILFHSDRNPWNIFLAWLGNFHWTHYFLWLTRKKLDVIGLNYYLHKKFGDDATYRKTDMGWDAYPEGIYEALLMLKRYKKPVYVSEAGIADAKDTMRAGYIKSLAASMHRAIEEGVDLRGYMYWSLIDNYEWASGFEKRFGLVEVNYETLKRAPRPSAYVYKGIIERNGLIE